VTIKSLAVGQAGIQIHAWFGGQQQMPIQKDCPVHLFLALPAIFQAAIDRYPGIVRRKVG
jgi:hypothetical protein